MKDRLLTAGYIVLIYLLLIVLLGLLPKPASAVGYSYGIPFEWRVVDGDTISTTSRPRKYFRLVGFDAPEITRPRCEAELLHGARAKEYLKSLLGSPDLLDRKSVV
jgi:endonuclease YncB( thermonuclease family)